MKNVLRASNLRDYCLFTLGINSGLRVSDLLKLKVVDVINRGIIKERIYIREMKTKKVKDFPISEAAKKALSDH
jgi:integrase